MKTDKIMFKTIIVNFDNEYSNKIRKIRNTVFSQEQKIDASADFDGQDTKAIHALIEMDGKYVGTGRMLMDGHIGRLAVLKLARGKGVGRQLILELMAEAKKQGIKRVYLGAQKQAVGFYQKLGFSEYGTPYEEVGIEHLHMEKFI
jgi:predicted GNAT family N-acyltransferase